MKNAVIIIECVVLTLGITSVAMAVPNSNSIIEDGIEYYIQTDKSIYDLGENVEMLFRVTNLTDDEVHIDCSRSGEVNFSVEQNSEAIWTRSHWFAWYSPGIDLSAGESIDASHIWDMVDDDGNLIGLGIYNVVGIMYNEPWTGSGPTEVAVPITIVPEPSSLVLFMACLSVLIRNKKAKHT